MSERRTPKGFWTIWTAVAIDLLGFGIIIPILPLYAEDFGATPRAIGLLVAAYSLAQFALAPVWGRLSDRFGRRPILLLTIAGSAVGSLILGLAGGLAMLFVGRVIDGASGASVSVARAAIADTASPSDRPRLMGLLGAAFGVGFVVGPLIGGLAALGGRSLPFFVAAGLSAVNLIVGWVRIPETRSLPVPQTGTASRSIPAPVRRLVALTFVTVVAFSAFEATFALLGQERLAMTPSSVAFAFAGVGVILVMTQAVLAGRLATRLGDAGSIRLGLLANVVGFVLLSEAASAGLLAAGLTFLAFGQGLLVPVVSSAVAGAAGTYGSGAALGAHASAGGLARAVGPVIGGVLFGMSTGGPYRFAAILVVAAVLLVPREGEPLISSP
jgi:MFS transporter, DHA1 family, tetracycline resistance protein